MESVEEKRKVFISYTYESEENTEGKENKDFFSPKQMSITKRNIFVADWQMVEEFENIIK